MPRLDHGQDSEKNSKKRTHLILQLLPNQIIQRKKGVIPSNHSPIVFGIFRTTKLLFMDNSEISNKEYGKKCKQKEYLGSTMIKELNL